MNDRGICELQYVQNMVYKKRSQRNVLFAICPVMLLNFVYDVGRIQKRLLSGGLLRIDEAV